MAVSVVSLAAAATVVGLTPMQASAVQPAGYVNIHPDASIADRSGKVLSDRFDGVDQTAHLTGVGTTDVAAVEYFVCPNTFASGSDPTAGPSGCTSLGVANNPAGVKPNAPAASGKAFGLNWDIPGTLDGQTRAIVAWACTQANARIPANCSSVSEQGIKLDDAQTGTPQTTAGELTKPIHGETFINGTTVTVRARTDTDVTALDACDNQPVNGTTPPGNCTQRAAMTLATTTATYKEWTISFGVGGPFANAEYTISIIVNGGGVGNAAGDNVQLDSHYVGAAPSTPTTARLTFGTQATCNATNAPAAVTSATDQAGNHEVVRGCLFDQGGNNITNGVDWAFQVTPIDGKQSTADPTGFDNGTDANNCASPPCHPGNGNAGAGFNGDGTENDTNADAYFEQVDGDIGSATGDGVADNQVEFHTRQAYTITFCWDSNNDAEFNPGPGSASPCANESVSASGTKTVTFNVIQHAHMRLASQVASDPTCHTGASQTAVPSGSSVNITVCGRDSYENGVNGVHIIWRLDGFGFFTSTADTTDSSGNGNATASSTRSTEDHQATVTACIDGNNNGACDTLFGAFVEPTAQFQITWQAATPAPPGASTLTLRKEARQNTRGPGGLVTLGGDLSGAAGTRCAGAEGSNSVKIHRGSSTGTVVASATTGSGGDYHATFKIFYRRRVAKNFVATFGGDADCQASTSNTVAVRGFRPN